MINHQASLDPVFHALADGTRRQIVARLSEGPTSVSTLAAPLAMSLPGVLQHLKVLESCGLVTTVKQGRSRICRLDLGPLDRAEAWIAERRAFWGQALDRLEGFLDSDSEASAGSEPAKDKT